MNTKRSAVSMRAVSAPAQRTARIPQSSARMKEVALVTALIVGVTAGGVALGMYGVSPLVEGVSIERMRELSGRVVAASFELVANIAGQPDVLIVLGMTAVATIAAYVGVGQWKRRAAKRAVSKSSSSAMTFTSRTPRDVQVLAAAGRKPAEIAARTRLPVDAVSMLLNLGQGWPGDARA